MVTLKIDVQDGKGLIEVVVATYEEAQRLQDFVKWAFEADKEVTKK